MLSLDGCSCELARAECVGTLEQLPVRGFGMLSTEKRLLLCGFF